MKILAIDTSGKTASVALTDGGLLLAEQTVYTRLTHSQIILPMAKEMLARCELTFSDIDVVACAKGPGSYTGLRIGIAAVKGIALGCPTIKCAGVSTLLALAWGVGGCRGRILSVMRARAGIVYAGLYENMDGKIISLRPDCVCSEDSLRGINGELTIVGDCTEDVKVNCFADRSDVICAPKIMQLQRAANLCAAVEADGSLIVGDDELAAAYLQETKAEKDKYHR